MAHDDVTLLGAQHVHALGAVRGDAELGTGGLNGFPHRQALAGRDVDFVAEFAREADAHDARAHACDRAFAVGHEGEGGFFEVHVAANFLEHGTRLRAGHHGGGPMVGHAGEVNLEVGPLGLQPTLQPSQHTGRTTRGGVHQVVVLAQAHGHAVVEHHAVFVEHQAVTALAHVELAPSVGVHPVEQDRGVGPLDVNLAQGGRVQGADRLAHGQAFAAHRGVQVFAVLGVVPRALPLADVFEQRAVLGVPVVDGGGADRVEQIAQLATGQQTEGDRCVVGAEGRGADLRDGLVHQLRGDAHAVDVAGFALVGAKAHGGVTLDVLDRLKAFAHRQMDVAGRHIVLEVHELLGRAAGAGGMGHFPQGQQVADVDGLELRGGTAGRGKTGELCRLGTGLPALGGTRCQVHGLAARTGRTLGLHRHARHKTGTLLLPHGFAARLAEEVNDRAQAARDGQEVTRHGWQGGAQLAFTQERMDLQRIDRRAAIGLHDHVARQHRNTQRACMHAQVTLGL